LSWLTFKDIYGAVFFEAASAWQGPASTNNKVYRSAGGELRLNMGSFYSYPTTLSVTGAYAMDKAVYKNPIASVAPVDYDPQWRYYVVMGFSF
jgi:hypothetical protein